MTKNKNYWFKRRRYGYGWIPSTLQGWLVVIVSLLLVIGGAVVISYTPKGEFTSEVAIYLTMVVGIAILLVILGMKKGPNPKWRWGKKSEDNSEEDF